MFQEAAKGIGQHGLTRVTIGMWPFTAAMFDHATDSAWPHVKGKPNCPVIVYYTWEGEENDQRWTNATKTTLNALREKVFKERPLSKDLPIFINTAFAEVTRVEDLYRANLSKLKKLRTKYDHKGVMDHTGGFRIPRA